MNFKKKHGLNVLNSAQIYFLIKREDWKLHLSTKRPPMTLTCEKWVNDMNRSQNKVGCKQKEVGDLEKASGDSFRKYYGGRD